MQSENNSHNHIIQRADKVKKDQNRNKQKSKNGKRSDDRDQSSLAISIYVRYAAERTAPTHAKGELFACLYFVSNGVYQLVQNDVCARNCNKNNVDGEQLQRTHFKKAWNLSVGNVQRYDGKGDDDDQNRESDQIKDDAEFGVLGVDVTSLFVTGG